MKMTNQLELSDDEYNEDEDSDHEDDDDIVEKPEKDEESQKKRKYDRDSEDRVTKIKRKKNMHTDLCKPPTVKELNQLRETTNLFHSNLFRLQINEMLNEVKMKEKYQSLFQQWFEKLKTFLDQLKDSKEYDIADTTWIKKMKIKLPVLQQPPSEKGVFQFKKPATVLVTGSYRMECNVGPTLRVDINVQMPQKCFQKSDHLNHRYDRKRALYLAFLACRLQDSDLVEEMSFLQARGNPLKPVLKLQLSGKLGKHVSALLHLSVPPSTFKLARFAPSKNNVRPNWFMKGTATAQDVEIATPHYNTNVLQDLTSSLNDDFISGMLKDQSNIRDGIVLLKVWLKQRGLDQGHGSFSGYIMAMYVIYLLHSKRLNNLMSSYQVVRIVWTSLAQSDWTQIGISLAPIDCQLSVEEFHKHFDVVFVDTSGFCNLCADVTCETFYKVKQESDLAVKFLDNPNVNSFQVLFMTPMAFHQNYDHIICFQDISVLERVVEQHGSKANKLNYSGQLLPQVLILILTVLRNGLGKRVSMLSVRCPNPAHWPCNKPPPDSLGGPVLIGLSLNLDFAFSIIDKGPAANLPEADEFRKFWGNKSELRRFKDGSISEAVVWMNDRTLAEKRVVCRQITQYVLSSHFKLKPDDYVYIADQVECILTQPKLHILNFKYGTGEEATLAVLRSFDGLAKQLRQLKDIPLDIISVQGISPVFRYCEVFPPVAARYWTKINHTTVRGNCSLIGEDNNTAPKWLLPVEGIIQLEMSGKWPNDREAIRRIRAAFHIKIAQCLAQQCRITVQPYPEHIDIFKDGFVYRIRVAYEREISLLKQRTSPEGLLKYQDSEESLQFETVMVHLPKITSALHGLHQQFPSLGPVCCLAKRWLAAQLLGPPHIPDMCTELLVANLYLAPEPFKPPCQPQLGFMRFLHLVSNTDWYTTPIIINLNGEMDREDILEMETRFHSARSALPALFLVTPYDRTDSRWTKEAPTLQILIRLGMLASEALKLLEGQLFSNSQSDFMQIFRPSLDAYDAVIHLQPHWNSRSHQSLDINLGQASLKPYNYHDGEKIPIIGFDPVETYLKELRESYNNFALFFHDCYGGNVIGVLWKPLVSEEKDLKVSNINCYKLKSCGSKIVVNLDAILEDFYILGSVLVRTIETKGNLLQTD